MELRAFITSLVTSFLISVVLIVLFIWLSRKPGNFVIYYPNRILRGLEPWEGGSSTRNPFAWIKEALFSTEADIVVASGVDTAVYFVFMSTVLGILVLSGIVLLPALLPVAITDHSLKASNTTSNGTFHHMDKLSMGHVKVNKIWVELEGYKKKLERAEAVYEKSKTVASPEGTRPTNKVGFLGLVDKKVDTIEYCNQKIDELLPKLESEQKITLREKQQSAAVVFFTTRVTAAAAAQSLHARIIDTWTVMDAPEARQILWRNLSLHHYEREIWKYIVNFIVALMILFFIVPIGIISAFTTLQNLRKLLPFLKVIVDVSVISTLLEAYLPQIALIVFLAALPSILLFLSKAEGIPSESHAVRATSGKYFYFTVLNVFIGVTIGGMLFSTFMSIEKEPNRIVNLLASSLPGNATFFLTYVALQLFVGYGLELSRIIPLITFHFKKKYLCVTEAEVKAAWSPGDIDYATTVPGDMLVFTIVICYSVIAPLIIPFGIAYFSIGWLVLRNQALKVYVPSYESYGRMWPHLYKRVVAALVLYQVTMFGYFAIKEFVYTALLIPLPIMSFIFAFVCGRKFYRFFKSTALEVVTYEPKEPPNMEQVFKSFLPQCLVSAFETVNEDQIEDAVSRPVSRSASFV